MSDPRLAYDLTHELLDEFEARGLLVDEHAARYARACAEEVAGLVEAVEGRIAGLPDEEDEG